MSDWLLDALGVFEWHQSWKKTSEIVRDKFVALFISVPENSQSPSQSKTMKYINSVSQLNICKYEENIYSKD